MNRQEYIDSQLLIIAADPANPTQEEKNLAAADADSWERSQAVDAWLVNLRDTDPDEFERVRKLSFEEQATLAGV